MKTVESGSTSGVPALEPGTIVAERYRIDRLLGRGGMAQVFAAYDLELERPLALKFLHQGVDLHPDSRRRFRREVALALRITHPNVIRLFDLEVASGQHFLTMELIAGESLRRTLRRGALPIEEAFEIARQSALGLAAAHEAGVVHRDFKPENVLISTEGRCVVADFGVATEDLIAATSASALVGTSAYMAPEQANGEAATPKADLYALGLVLFEMLAHEVPLLGAGPVATAMRREKERAPSILEARPEVPAAIEELLASLLERDPQARPASASYVAEQLAPFARPLAPRPPPADDEDDADRLDSSERDTSALDSNPNPSATRKDKRSATPRPRTPQPGTPQARATAKKPSGETKTSWRTLLWVVIVAALLGVAQGVAMVWLSPSKAKLPPLQSQSLLAIDKSTSTPLPPSLAFLASSIGSVAYRALAAQLPGRVVLTSSNASPAVPVLAIALRSVDGRFVASYALAGRPPVEGQSTRVASAFDEAAKAFVAATFPQGILPSEEEEQQRKVWLAPSAEAVRTVRRAVVEFSRAHDEEALRLASTVSGPSFLRPLITKVAVLGAVGPMNDELRHEVATALTGAGPATDRALLKGMLAIAETEAVPVPTLQDKNDPLERYNRAWSLAYSGRFDEAYGESEHLGGDAVYGGLGWRQAYDFARYYDDERETDMARQLADHLPEEAWSWVQLAKARLQREELGEARESIARARSLGAEESELLDAEAQLAIATFDLERAARLGRQMLTSSHPTDRLVGHETLFSVEVMRGQFAAARDRMDALEAAFKQEPRVDTPDDALELGQDSFGRGDAKLAERFMLLAQQLAMILKDYEYSVSAQSKLAAFRRATGVIGEPEFLAELARQEKLLRDRGISLQAREYASYAKLIVALGAVGGKRCEALRDESVNKLSNRPLVIIAMAECELQQKAPERAIARLASMFVGHGRRTYPTLVVKRELLLGEALTMLGRTSEARPHLERVVSLWNHAPDKGEVGRAQKLLGGK